MKLKAKMWIEKRGIVPGLKRDIIHIEVNGYRLTGFGIHADNHNEPNRKEDLEFAQAIVDKLNEGQEEEIGEPKLFIETN